MDILRSLAQRKLLILISLTVVAYLAAINRAQAFVWVIPALLLAVLITGISWPRWLVRRLAVSRSGPSRAEEGQSIVFRVEVQNQGWLPRFMVELVDRLPSFGNPAIADGMAERTLGMLAYLPGGRSRQFDIPVLCEKRGHYRIGPIGLASSFPLGLTEARQQRGDGIQTLTVYPELFPILALPLRGAPSQIHRGGYLLPEGAGAAEFSGLREYRRGDNPRHIHWPTTARLNELMVREYEPLASACVYLLLDQASWSNAGHGRDSTFEYAVKIAASIARSTCNQNIRTRLAGSGAHPLHIPPGNSPAHFQTILDTLAVVDCDGKTLYAALIDSITADCLRGETAIVFISEPAAYLTDTLRAIAALRARQVHVFAIVFDRHSFDPQASNTKHAGTIGALLELGADCIEVRCGDKLVQLFNP